MNNKSIARISLLFVAILWGLTFIMVKEALNDAPPFSFASLRFGLATILTLIILNTKLLNLTKQEILFGNKKIEFEIDLFKKKCLLNGLDDIAMTLEQSKKISSYENESKKNKPWMN